MKNLNETTESCFLKEADALKLFTELCATDVWQRCGTNELQVQPIDDAPILMQEIRTKLNIAAEVTDDSMSECMDSLNLGVSVPFETGYKTYPIGETSLGTLVQRAGYQMSPVLMSTSPKASMNVMSPINKSMVLNNGLQQFKNKALVLIRDEKIRAILSGDEADYQIFPMVQLTSILKSVLSRDFTDVNFSYAFASHQYMGIYYTFDAHAVMGEDVRTLLSRIGINSNDMKAGVFLITSDVGLSGANLYPYIHGNGHNVMIGTPLTLTHKGSNTLETFEANVSRMLSIFKDAEARLNEMDQKKVNHPAGCLMRIAKQAGLPKKISCEAAESLEATFGINCYQADVFFALYDILESYYVETEVSSSKKIMLEEGISRVVFSNFGDYDIPFQWE